VCSTVTMTSDANYGWGLHVPHLGSKPAMRSTLERLMEHPGYRARLSYVVWLCRSKAGLPLVRQAALLES
jgi:hypothetical protein